MDRSVFGCFKPLTINHIHICFRLQSTIFQESKLAEALYLWWISSCEYVICSKWVKTYKIIGIGLQISGNFNWNLSLTWTVISMLTTKIQFLYYITIYMSILINQKRKCAIPIFHISFCVGTCKCLWSILFRPLEHCTVFHGCTVRFELHLD